MFDASSALPNATMISSCAATADASSTGARHILAFDCVRGAARQLATSGIPSTTSLYSAAVGVREYAPTSE